MPGRGGFTTPCQVVAMLPTMVAPTSTCTKGRVSPFGPQRHVEHADHALVACEQAGHAGGGFGVDREQVAGHMHHAAQARGGWHVDAVVVLGAEVDGGEVAIGELRSQRRVAADQGQGAVAVALGLEDLVALDAAELADRAVHRADKGGIGQRASAGFERPGEELVEGRVSGRIGVRRLGHVDAVALDEAADDGLGDAPALPAGDAPGQSCQGQLGHQVLQGDEQGHEENLGQRVDNWRRL